MAGVLKEIIHFIEKKWDEHELKSAKQKCNETYGRWGEDDYEEEVKCEKENQEKFDNKWNPNGKTVLSSAEQPIVNIKDEPVIYDDQPTDGFGNDARRILTKPENENPLSGVMRDTSQD